MIFTTLTGEKRQFLLKDIEGNLLNEDDIIRNTYKEKDFPHDFIKIKGDPFRLRAYKKDSGFSSANFFAFMPIYKNESEEKSKNGIVECFGSFKDIVIDFGLFTFNSKMECIEKKLAFSEDYLLVNIKDKFFKLDFGASVNSLGFEIFWGGRRNVYRRLEFSFSNPNLSMDNIAVSNLDGACIVKDKEDKYHKQDKFTQIIVDDHVFTTYDMEDVYISSKEEFEKALSINSKVEES